MATVGLVLGAVLIVAGCGSLPSSSGEARGSVGPPVTEAWQPCAVEESGDGRVSAAADGLEPTTAAPGEGPVTERWVIDPERVRSIFYTGPPVETASELFEVRMLLEGAAWTVPTHRFAEEFRLVPYDNGDQAVDASGRPLGRGDSAIAALFPPGEVGFAIKHHRAAQRVQDLPYRSRFLLREELKLQGSHLLLVVGIERGGSPGAVSLSAPQTYEGGRFGTASYPMVFVRPVFPAGLDPAVERAFRDNLRTMMVGFSSVAQFPSSYGSGDPMASSTPDAVREHVGMMVRAIGGDSAAVRWFREGARRLYCGELGLLAVNAAVLVPLNARSLVPLVGEEAWTAFVDQVAVHQRREESRFSSLNQNRWVPAIDVTTAPEDLQPLSSYVSDDLAKRLGQPRFAFEPQSAADLLRVYLSLVVPAMDGAKPIDGRLEEEVDVPALRGELVRTLTGGFLQILDLGERSPNDPDRGRVEELMERLAIAAEVERDGEHAMPALEPILDELRAHLLTLDPPAGALLAPPSLFQAVTQGLWPSGLLDLEYVGHGLHVSLLRPEEPPEN